MPLLEVRNISKYFGGLAALSDLDLNVNQGEIRGLIGPNGSGKTTLFNVVSGVFRPTKGRVIFKGEDITGLKPHAVAKKRLVRTFQLTTLFKSLDTLGNVRLGSHLHTGVGFWGALFNTPATIKKERDVEKKATKILETVGLSKYKHELAMNLPHGHQRALGIAVALATEPELLMLDEPFTGMNPEETNAMMGTIKKIRDRGITVLLVEHDMRAVMGLCDNVTAINFGKKIAEGSPEEITKNKDVIEAYLGAEEYVT